MRRNLGDYAGRIALYEPIRRPPVLSKDEEEAAQARVLAFLSTEEGRSCPLPPAAAEPALRVRALLNVRPPLPIPAGILGDLDGLLWTQRVRAGVVRATRLPSVEEALGYGGPHGRVLSVWRGDIVRLDADAIVNAANGGLLGCFAPLHPCSDNAIHSAAGPRLREDCATLVGLQGREEEPGGAKVTRAHNLPSRFVLHTVGPRVRGEVAGRDRELLSSAYEACLDLAAETGRVASLAFCCISTGVFGFPADAAAAIAVRTVCDWLDRNPGAFERIVFDVFTEGDHARYARLLSR